MIYSYTHAWHQWQIDFWVNNIDELQRTLEEHEWGLSNLSASAILIEHHKLVERVAACPASSGCWLRALPYHLTSTRAPRNNISCLGAQALRVMRWEAQVDEPVVHPRWRDWTITIAVQATGERPATSVVQVSKTEPTLDSLASAAHELGHGPCNPARAQGHVAT